MTDLGVARNSFMTPIGVEFEVAAIPSGLHGEESGIKAHPDKHEKDVLLMGQDWARCGLGKIRHNETEYRQWNDQPKIGVGALEIVLLLTMAPATDQQRQPPGVALLLQLCDGATFTAWSSAVAAIV